MKNYTLTFTGEQLRVIDQALQEIPFRFAAPLIAEINKQIEAQESHDIPSE
jgi:hypothetical protein